MRADPRNHEAMFLRMYRADAWCEQGRVCLYCHSRVSRNEVTGDHKTPRSKGGLTRRDNITATCSRCNNAKGSMSHALFLKAIKRPLITHPLSIWWAWARRRIWIRCERAERRILALVGESATGRSAGVSS